MVFLSDIEPDIEPDAGLDVEAVVERDGIGAPAVLDVFPAASTAERAPAT
jgi:hypothetical protein